MIVVFLTTVVFGQGASLSLFDLKQQYFEKKNSFKTNTGKTVSADEQFQLDRIVTLLEENAPNSYEYHLVKAANLNFAPAAETELLKAKKLKPDELEVNWQLFEYYCFTGNLSKQKQFAPKISSRISTPKAAYYTQLLAPAEANFYVFSNAEDALPAYYLQANGKIGYAVEVINLEFLSNDTYRKKIQTKLGMQNLPFLNNEAQFVTAMLKAKKNVRIATTVGQNYLKNSASNMYVIGLSYAYQHPNQYEALMQFWLSAKENVKGVNLTSSSDKKLYSNYLPPLLTLYKIKRNQNETDEVLKQGILLLAKKIGKEREVDELLKRYG